jgi:hypothetical protein
VQKVISQIDTKEPVIGRVSKIYHYMGGYENGKFESSYSGSRIGDAYVAGHQGDSERDAANR